MRYFKSTPELFNAFRAALIEQLGLPRDGTEQPWDENITSLALALHEYSDKRFAPMIAAALESGQAEEISEEEYQRLHPKSSDELKIQNS